MKIQTNVSIPRPEHPNPQFFRKNWINLNGLWDFDFDFGASGIERKFFEQHDYPQKILVPFCPESQLSGISYTDFIPCCWYHRTFTLSQTELTNDILLHFGAVDYEAHIFINGQKAGMHKGGYASFSVNITPWVKEGENDLTVCAYDDPRSERQPRGKQSSLYYSHDCDYTRTTGIWQTVWLEFIPQKHICNFRLYPNVSDTTVALEAKVTGSGTLHAQAFYENRLCGEATVHCNHGIGIAVIRLSEKHIWEVGHGRLYDLKLTFEKDIVTSYFGLREVALDGYRFLLNGKSVFQRLVLDQGFYPDGIYTAPDAAALEKDIKLSLAAGFNGARLHQKVFEPLFLYYCDRNGYLVWGETGSWGLDISTCQAYESFEPEWLEIISRDFNHPAIIGWCPFNETWDTHGAPQQDSILRQIYQITKTCDPTRPCIDTSGHYHVVTDIYDIHNYEQNPEKFNELYAPFGNGEELYELYPTRQHYTKGLPVFISEYGGIKWAPDNPANVWGYGDAPKSPEEFTARYEGLTTAILKNPHIMGFCYTQLTDVEQECNGIYNYDRTTKLNPEIFRRVNTQKAAIED